MKNIFTRFPFGMILLGCVIILAAARPDIIWQPPQHDSSLTGKGTDDDLLKVVHPVVYSVTANQATTAAPTVYEHANIIGNDTTATYTRDSIGHYKINFHQAVLTDSTFTYSATMHYAAAGFVNKFGRLNDSIAFYYVFSKTGIGADLVGKAYLEIKGAPPE